MGIELGRPAAEDYEAWAAKSIAGHAAQIVASGGYGREAMVLAEAEARSRGMQSVGLNVHGSNKIAASLYASLGCQVTMQQMNKTL